MPKNNSKARRTWRKVRANNTDSMSPEERLLRAIFGEFAGTDDRKPGTEGGG